MSGVSYNPMNGRLTAGQKPFSYKDAKPQEDSSNQWSSTENNRNNARNVNFSNGNANNNNKNNGNVVRPVAASQDYDVPEAFVVSVWEAYFDCLRGKMRSKQAVEYMEIADEDIPKLALELWSGTYHPGTSTCFPCTLPQAAGGVCSQLQGQDSPSLDMSATEPSVRGTIRETRERVVQLPQGIRDGEGRSACGQRDATGELQLQKESMGVQGRLGWILHVDRQRAALVSLGTLHASPADTPRKAWMERPRHRHTRTAQHGRDAEHVLGYSRQDDQGRCDAPSRTGLHTEHLSARMAWAGTEQEPVYQSNGRAYRKLDDTTLRQLPDVAFRGVHPMAVPWKELLFRTVRGRLRDSLRRPALPCGQPAQDRGVFEWQVEAQTPQEQTLPATCFTWSEVRWRIHQAQEDIPVEPNRCPHDGTLPRLCQADGRARIGGLGAGAYRTDP